MIVGYCPQGPVPLAMDSIRCLSSAVYMEADWHIYEVDRQQQKITRPMKSCSISELARKDEIALTVGKICALMLSRILNVEFTDQSTIPLRLLCIVLERNRDSISRVIEALQTVTKIPVDWQISSVLALARSKMV